MSVGFKTYDEAAALAGGMALLFQKDDDSDMEWGDLDALKVFLFQQGLGGLLLAKAAPSIVHTGTTAKTTLASVVVPGGLLGPNGFLRIKSRWTYTNSANAKTPGIDFGGTTFRAPPLTTSSAWTDESEIFNVNDVAVQQGPVSNATNAFSSNSGSLTAGAVDTSADQTLALTATLANTGEQLVLRSYEIWAYR